MIPRQTMLGLLAGLTGVAIFGATLPMTRLAVAALDPWFVTFGRAALAGLLAGLVLLVLRRKPPPRQVWAGLGVAALCLVFGFPGFIGLGMLSVPAAHGAGVLGVLPLATAAAAALVAGERPSLLFWAFGALGALLVVTFAVLHGGAGGLATGDLFLLAAVLCTGLGYALSGVLSRGRPGWEVISWMLVGSLPVTAAAAWWTAPASLASVPWQAWAAFLYLAVMSQYVGFFFWNAALAMGGVARIGQLQLLQPFVSIAVAALMLGETIDTMTMAFAVLVLGVVVLGRRAPVGQRKPRPVIS
jgi:drug/metabolite transporter (DMT)-like permease